MTRLCKGARKSESRGERVEDGAWLTEDGRRAHEPRNLQKLQKLGKAGREPPLNLQKDPWLAAPCQPAENQCWLLTIANLCSFKFLSLWSFVTEAVERASSISWKPSYNCLSVDSLSPSLTGLPRCFPGAGTWLASSLVHLLVSSVPGVMPDTWWLMGK